MTSYVSAPVGEALFLVLTEDQNVGRSLFLKQTRGEIGVLSRAVALVTGILGDEAIEGQHFLDVGANIGTTTVPAMLDHPFAAALAFEPEPRNALTLRLNLVLNGIEDRTTALDVALSNRSGTAQLVVYPDQGGKHWLADDDDKLEQRSGDTTVTEVRTTTLDELTAEGIVNPRRVGMLWIDAQAHEGQILAGASGLTERGVPVVIEWDPLKLDRIGDREALQTILEGHYTHFIDLRASDDPKGLPFELRETAALGEYADRFLEPGGQNLTDILTLRLKRDVPADLDIRKLLQRQGALKPRSPESRSRMELLRELIAGLDELDGGARRSRATPGDTPGDTRPKSGASTPRGTRGRGPRTGGTAPRQRQAPKKRRRSAGRSERARPAGRKSASGRKAGGPETTPGKAGGSKGGKRRGPLKSSSDE